MYKLVCLAGVHLGQEFPLKGSKFTIGRKADNDLRISSPFISKFHAEIECDTEEQYWIQDLGSKNGTYVDEREVVARQLLEEGNKIIFGRSDIFKFIQDKSIVAPEDLKSDDDFAYSNIFDRYIANPDAEEENGEIVEEGAAWTNIDELPDELESIFSFEGEAAKSKSERPRSPKVIKSESSKFQMKNEILERVYSASRVLIVGAVSGEFAGQLHSAMNHITPYEDGVLALKVESGDTSFWKPYYLKKKDYAFFKETLNIHQEQQKQNSAVIIPLQNKEKVALYYNFRSSDDIVGYMIIRTNTKGSGFGEAERLGFEYICQLLEDVVEEKYLNTDQVSAFSESVNK